MTDELNALPASELDYVDAIRRLDLAQQEINALDAMRVMHNDRIVELHRDLHEAAALIGDIRLDDGAKHLHPDVKARIVAHVEKHGHPQDVPEGSATPGTE